MCSLKCWNRRVRTWATIEQMDIFVLALVW
jgi:hypothetical protein